MSCSCNQTCNRQPGKKSSGIVACDSIGKFDFIEEEECIESSIQIKGLCSEEELETKLEAGENNWTEMFIPEVLCIPTQKPDIEAIISVSARVDIISQRVVVTPQYVGDNSEGIQSTGRKLVIEGILRQTIIYTAAKKVQSVHAAHFDVPFSAFIIIPADTPVNRIFTIEPCIEDVFICALNERQIFKNVTLFIKATERSVCLIS
jgi:hypothetical protein